MRFIDNVRVTIKTLAQIAAAILLYFCFMKIFVQPITPYATGLFVLVFTVRACERFTTGILSLGGLALYGVAWLTYAIGSSNPDYVAQMPSPKYIALLGIVVWFIAILAPSFMRAKPVAA